VRGIRCGRLQHAPDIQTDAVIARLERSLSLIEHYVPTFFGTSREILPTSWFSDFACGERISTSSSRVWSS